MNAHLNPRVALLSRPLNPGAASTVVQMDERIDIVASYHFERDHMAQMLAGQSVALRSANQQD